MTTKVETDVRRSGRGGALQSALTTAQQERLPVKKVSLDQSWRLLATYVAYCCVYLCRKPVSVVKPMLSSDLGFSTAALARIDTAWSASYAVGQLGLGVSRSFCSGRSLVALAFLFSGVFTMALARSATEASFAIYWGLNGLFQASINPLLVLFVAENLPPRRRASGVGLWQTSQQVGGVLANLMASATLRAGLPWQAVFRRSGFIVMACAAPAFVALSTKVSPLEDDEATTPKKTSRRRFRIRWPFRQLQSDEEEDSPTKKKKKIFPQNPASLPGVKATCVAYFLVKMTRYCLIFWLPFFLARAAGVAPAEAARMATWLDVGGILGSVSVGLVADRLFGGAMLTACAPFALLTSLCLTLLGLGYDHGATLKNAGLLFAAGFFVAAPDGVLGGAAAKNVCDYNRMTDAKLPAAVSGLINGCGSVGAILQGMGTAALVSRFGWTALFVALAVLMSSASIVLLPAVRLERSFLNDQQQTFANLV